MVEKVKANGEDLSNDMEGIARDVCGVAYLGMSPAYVIYSPLRLR